jgi:hypothetical protein
VTQLENHVVLIALTDGPGKSGKPSLALYFGCELKPGECSCEDSVYESIRTSGVVRVARRAGSHPPDEALPLGATSG